MTAIPHSQTNNFGLFTRTFAALAAAAALLAKRWMTYRQHRTDMAVLASLDDRTLADMGLTRADVRDAVAQPLWRDPTAVLADRRRERQLHDYRAIFAQLMREQKSIPLAPEVPTIADACGYPQRQPPARLTL